MIDRQSETEAIYEPEIEWSVHAQLDSQPSFQDCPASGLINLVPSRLASPFTPLSASCLRYAGLRLLWSAAATNSLQPVCLNTIFSQPQLLNQNPPPLLKLTATGR